MYANVLAYIAPNSGQEILILIYFSHIFYQYLVWFIDLNSLNSVTSLCFS